MRRHEMTDEQFKRIEFMLPGRAGHVGVTAQDNKNFIDGVLWIFKTGAPWRDLPERYGNWKNVHRRFLVGHERESLTKYFEFYRKMLICNFC